MFQGKTSGKMNFRGFFVVLFLLLSTFNQAQATSISQYPDLITKDFEGQKFDLRSKRGKIILINFWTSWCPNCRREIKRLNEFQRKYKNPDFEIIGVNLDEDDKRVQAAEVARTTNYYNVRWVEGKKTNDLNWTNEFGFQRFIPADYLIDKNGKLRNDLLPNSDLPEDFDKLVEIIESLK